MKITAITRYKHGDLFAMLNRLGWTQLELARRAGLDSSRISEIINLNKRPSQKSADAIQRAFGEAGEYFDVLEQWPESFSGIERGTTKHETIEVEIESLLGCREAMMAIAPDTSVENELNDALDECMDTLTEKERRVIEARFFESRTMPDLAKQFGYSSPERIRQIEAKALRKLRQPAMTRNLNRFSCRRSA